MELSKCKVLLILFTPFILNILISSIIGMYVSYNAYLRGLRGEEIGIEVQKALYTVNFYWSIIQVGIGLYVIKLMGGWSKFEEKLSFRDIRESPAKSLALIAALIMVTLGIIWFFLGLSAHMFYGGWGRFAESWKKVVAGLPLYSKIYLVAIAPFTAGIFEEAIWRWFGIESLSKHYSPRKAVAMQAIAFGVWHGLTLHAVATAIVGAIYGLVYLKRKRLLILVLAHIVSDIIGFSMSVFAV